MGRAETEKISARDPDEELAKAIHMFDDDDTGVITLNGPSTAAEFAEGAADPVVGLTEFVT